MILSNHGFKDLVMSALYVYYNDFKDIFKAQSKGSFPFSDPVHLLYEKPSKKD
jgi:hypothetical protein